MDSYIMNNSVLTIFSDEFKEKYKKTGIEYLKKYENLNKHETIKQLLSFYKTWDLYSLSIIYLKFFKILFSDGFFDNKLIITFSQLLLYNISPNTNNRNTIKETLTMYKDIFYINEKPENYFTLINNLKYL